jgi:hypothetical protein
MKAVLFHSCQILMATSLLTILYRSHANAYEEHDVF